MAVDLEGASDKINFGDIAGFADITKLSVAITLDVDARAENNRICGQFGNGSANWAWAIVIKGGDEVLLHVQNTASHARFSVGLNVTPGTLHRLVVTWDAALAEADQMRFWSNGVEFASTASYGTPQTKIKNVTTDVDVGNMNPATFSCVDAGYSEFACWDVVVPDWFAIAYGKGLSPRFYRTGGIIYAPLISTDYLVDVWGGVLGANTGGVTAPHPSVYNPAPVPLVGLKTEPVVVLPVTRLRGRDDTIIGARGRDDTILGLKGRDDTTARLKGERESN